MEIPIGLKANIEDSFSLAGRNCFLAYESNCCCKLHSAQHSITPIFYRFSL